MMLEPVAGPSQGRRRRQAQLSSSPQNPHNQPWVVTDFLWIRLTLRQLQCQGRTAKYLNTIVKANKFDSLAIFGETDSLRQELPSPSCGAPKLFIFMDYSWWIRVRIIEFIGEKW
jgi:hypothetical protein